MAMVSRNATTRAARQGTSSAGPCTATRYEAGMHSVCPALADKRFSMRSSRPGESPGRLVVTASANRTRARLLVYGDL